MMTFGTFIKDVENVPGELAHLFTAHHAQIQTVLSEAKTAVSGATAIAAILEPAAVPELTLVADGLTRISASVTAESTATTLTSQVSVLGGLVSGLVTAGDVNVKNATVKSAITGAVTKAQTVLGALVTAVSVAPTTQIAA